MPFALKTHSSFTSRISHLWAKFKAFNIYSYIPFTAPYQNRKYPVLFYNSVLRQALQMFILSACDGFRLT